MKMFKKHLCSIAVVACINPVWAADTYVCLENAAGDTRRVDDVPILTSPSSSSNANYVVVASGAYQTTRRGGQRAFIENGGEFFGDGGGGHSLYIASGGAAEIDGGGGHRVYVEAGGTVTCGSIGGGIVIEYETNAVLVNCTGNMTLKHVPTTRSFEQCSPSTVVDALWGKVALTVTRDGNTVTFGYNNIYANDSTSWEVQKHSSFNTWETVATSTDANGFSAELTEFNGFHPYYIVDLELYDSVFDETLSSSRVFW